jgi:prolipoprotein diacylglyceryltransferase
MKASLRQRCNYSLDTLVRTEVTFGGRTWSAFQVCGCTGLELAVLLAMGLLVYRGLSPWVMGAIIGAAIATFYAVVYATKIITGEERLTYYHHEIAVAATGALIAWALGQPVAAYLDATVLGVGAFLACGRVGCLMVGCCHGRPHRWGVRYRREHAAAGFPAHYVGVRLFPIQVVESLWVAGAVIVGAAMVLRGAPYGAAMAWYVVVYDIGRFGFEFVRGDSERAFPADFSEGQWTALALTWLVGAAELAGLLPFRGWHLAVAAGLALTMLLVAARRRSQADGRHRLLRAQHVEDVAAAITAPAHGDVVRVAVTSLGYRISAGELVAGGRHLRHYTVSGHNAPLSGEVAATLIKLICDLQPGAGGFEILGGTRGAVHLVAYSAE